MANKNFMGIVKEDYEWIAVVFHARFSMGLSKICDPAFLKARYDAFRGKGDQIYLALLDGMKDEALSRTFVSYWTIAHTLATQTRFWIEDAIAEVLIRAAQKNKKHDLRIYSQSMLSNGWLEEGISVADIGEEKLEHLSDRRPWRVSMQKHTLESIDVIVGEHERERVEDPKGTGSEFWDKYWNLDITTKDQNYLERVVKSLTGPPVSEATLQCNLLVVEPHVSDSKPHAWAFRFVNSKTISSHPSRKQERVNLLRLFGYLVQEKILRDPQQIKVQVAELLPRKSVKFHGQDRYPHYFSSLTYWSTKQLWDFLGIPFELVTSAIDRVATEFRTRLISGLSDLLPGQRIPGKGSGTLFS